MAAYSLSLNVVTAAAVTASLTRTATRWLGLGILCTATVTAGMTQRSTQWLSASIGVKASVGAGLRHGRLFLMKSNIITVAAVQAHFCTLGNGMTVRDAVKAILAMWGQSCGNNDSPEKGEAVAFLNAAMQQLYMSGKDFGFVSRVRRTYEQDVDNVTPLEYVELESDVQAVEGNVVLEKGVETASSVEIYAAATTPLRPLGTAEALESTRQRYGVGRSNEFVGAPNRYQNPSLSRPLGYFVRGDTETQVRPRLRIELAPTVVQQSAGVDAVPFTLYVDVALQPPRYSCCDVDRGVKLPVPYRHAESLLVPLARYRALSARYRVREEVRAQITQEAALALTLLGEADPRDAEVQRNRKEGGKT